MVSALATHDYPWLPAAIHCSMTRRLIAVAAEHPPKANAAMERHQERANRAFALLSASGVLGERGIGMEEKVLWAFLRVDTADVTQRELCEIFGFARSTLNRILRRLELLVAQGTAGRLRSAKPAARAAGARQPSIP
jgi:hypothetical protein